MCALSCLLRAVDVRDAAELAKLVEQQDSLAAIIKLDVGRRRTW